jgi:hypothetical protein
MFCHLSRAARLRATVVVAAAYALCVVAPHAALALTHVAVALHCLTKPVTAGPAHPTAALVEHTHADGSKHVHHDAARLNQVAQHTHDDHGKGGHNETPAKNDSNCCGLFCVTALSGGGVDVLPLPPSRSSKVALLQSTGTSHIPSRITEPPIG